MSRWVTFTAFVLLVISHTCMHEHTEHPSNDTPLQDTIRDYIISVFTKLSYKSLDLRVTFLTPSRVRVCVCVSGSAATLMDGKSLYTLQHKIKPSLTHTHTRIHKHTPRANLHTCINAHPTRTHTHIHTHCAALALFFFLSLDLHFDFNWLLPSYSISLTHTHAHTHTNAISFLLCLLLLLAISKNTVMVQVLLLIKLFQPKVPHSVMVLFFS